ncbi:thiamine diphosphokinase [Alloscardovia venturai]|uniref:Thiamine diphosphokinase n=1 Tax=Alloscardovia venturai TaxID=1769421 RepID=A0ABW2Y4D8_9BIFI
MSYMNSNDSSLPHLSDTPMQLPGAKRAIIFGAGSYYDEMPFVPADALVIAADGGYDHVISLGITPHAFIGDMDSVLEDIPQATTTTVIKLSREKDDTDVLAAVRYAWNLGIREFEFFGILGGRIDHSLANIHVAARIASHGGIAFLHGDHTITTVITDAVMTFPAGYVAAGRYISILSHSSISEHVSIQGLKYCIDDVRMTNISPIGVSNEFLPDTPATIAVEGGSLIIVYPSEAPTPHILSEIKPSKDFGALTTSPSSHLSELKQNSPRRGRHAA